MSFSAGHIYPWGGCYLADKTRVNLQNFIRNQTKPATTNLGTPANDIRTDDIRTDDIRADDRRANNVPKSDTPKSTHHNNPSKDVALTAPTAQPHNAPSQDTPNATANLGQSPREKTPPTPEKNPVLPQKPAAPAIPPTPQAEPKPDSLTNAKAKQLARWPITPLIKKISKPPKPTAIRPKALPKIKPISKMWRVCSQALPKKTASPAQPFGKRQSRHPKDQWAKAIPLYQQALQLSNTPEIIAQKHLAETVTQHLHHSQSLLADPDSLLERENRQLLSHLKQHSAKTTPHSPRLQENMQKLQLAEQNLEKPVAVTVNSDGKSFVRILGVGNLGEITTKTITLKPGHYRLEAARDGYRNQIYAIKIP